MEPAAAESYWIATTDTTAYPALTDDLDADVAVVGAGIAGVCAAWELIRAGRRVVVLEADRILAATTGHTTAKLTAQHGLIYEHLRSWYGPETTRHYAQSQSAAVRHVIDTAAALGVDCELERLPAYTYVTDADRIGQVRAEADAAQQAGLPAEAVTDTGLPFAVAAVRLDDQAQFHPRRYLLALAEDLTRRGGRIFERTRVTGLDDGEPCRLTTELGATIQARDVVVATHYPIFDRALLFSRLRPRRELVVCGVADPGQDPAGMYITSEQNTRSVRTAPYPDGQRLLIITGEIHEPGAPGVLERRDRLAAWAREEFGVLDIAYSWSAQDNSTTDRIPYIGRFHPGTEHVYVATGFGGWGMSNGVLAGQLLAALIAGEPPPWGRIYDPRRLHPVVEAGSFLKSNAAVARHFVTDRLRAAATTPEALSPGEGAVMRVQGEQLAVHRDDFGRLHALSAICSHLGCVVGFNDAERTWDCPCHGSRFAADGAVLHGPATQSLPLRKLD